MKRLTKPKQYNIAVDLFQRYISEKEVMKIYKITKKPFFVN
jgi:hypothetical protein